MVMWTFIHLTIWKCSPAAFEYPPAHSARPGPGLPPHSLREGFSHRQLTNMGCWAIFCINWMTQSVFRCSYLWRKRNSFLSCGISTLITVQSQGKEMGREKPCCRKRKKQVRYVFLLLCHTSLLKFIQIEGVLKFTRGDAKHLLAQVTGDLV